MNSTKANPYVYTKEVTDADLFTGREYELESMNRELSNFADGGSMRNLALTGVQRVGKTSVLLRIVEMCDKKGIFPVIVTIEEKYAKDPWEFWCVVYKEIIAEATKKGIVDSKPGESLTFWRYVSEDEKKECHLLFEEEYSKYKMGAIAIKNPDESLIHRDMSLIMRDIILDKKFKGMVLMFDEAQKLQEFQESRDIKESIRNIFTSKIEKVGLIFAGLERLGKMFTEQNEPFNGRGHIIPIKNFTSMSDIRKCALQPLQTEERKMMSPMTIDYIALLSRGMPNFVRLICYAIYDRYQSSKQKDLSLTIEIMDDLLDVMEKDAQVEGGTLQRIINGIKSLKSVELEILYSLTRFSGWSLEEIIELDESFRGEAHSEKASQRREKMLEEQREIFIKKGLMEANEKKFVLSGGEFVSDYAGLYLRFWYEVQKYGELARNIIVGKGPQTLFGEKTDKLADAINFETRDNEYVSREPGITISIFNKDFRDRGQVIVDRVLERYRTFKQIRKGELTIDEECLRILIECTEVCQFVEKPGKYLLVCLSIRNREQHRELVQLELYYKIDEGITQPAIIDLSNFIKQAENAKVEIEGQATAIIEYLPDLDGLFKDFGTCRDDFLNILELDEKWLIDSVVYLVSEKAEKRKVEEKEDEDIRESKWIDEYKKDHVKEAEHILASKIALYMGSDSKKLARLYNDIGYIYSGDKTKYDTARHNLELAFDYHHTQLTLTLLNLSYLEIMKKQYKRAIQRIENVLLLTHGREEISASYLRTIVPESNLMFMKQVWEHSPANILEVSYILLAYAVFKDNGDAFNKAEEIISEGLTLLPSSIWLKHALARYYSNTFQAPKARTIYRELSVLKIEDASLKWEISNYMKLIPKSSR